MLAKIYRFCVLLLVFIFYGCNKSNHTDIKNQYGLALSPPYYSPQVYYCHPLTCIPKIDGIISNEEWDEVDWSNSLISSISNESPVSNCISKFKLAYANDSLYFAAIVHSDHIWSTVDICESNFFDDNFLKLAIDYDNDEFDYLILKFNALGNFCGEYWNTNNIQPLSKFSLIENQKARCAVYVKGTVNNPKDIDQFWTIEAAIPLDLKLNGVSFIKPNNSWKINVQRSRWISVIVSGIYKKVINSDTGKKYQAEQWVWSSMGDNPIHKVELWGECLFDTNKNSKEWKEAMLENRQIKWELRNIYYAQQLHLKKHRRYARKVAGLKDVGLDLSSLNYKPDIQSTEEGFKISIRNPKTREVWEINEAGKITVIPIES